MSLFEQGAVGITAVNIAGLTTYSLTTANNATDQARFLVQQYTGALIATCTVTIPNLTKVGWAQNATTGGHTVVLSAGGTTATIPADSQWYMFYCDGATNVALVPIGAASLRASTVTADGVVVGAAGINDSGPLTVTGATALGGTLGVFGSSTTPVASTGNYNQTSALYNVTGTVTYSVIATAAIVGNQFYALSDGRTKSAVKPISIEMAYDWVRNGRPVTYVKMGELGAGFIAQDEIRSGRGASVKLVPDDTMIEGDDLSPAGWRLVKNYEHDIAYLTAAIQGLMARVAELESAQGGK